MGSTMSLLRVAIFALAVTGPAAAADGDRPTDDAVIARWQEANGSCRGGSGDQPETWAWCAVRDGLDQVLGTRGWCYGKKDQAGFEMVWHRCGPDSNPPSLPKME